MNTFETKLWFRGFRMLRGVDVTNLATVAIGTLAIAIALGSII